MNNVIRTAVRLPPSVHKRVAAFVIASSMALLTAACLDEVPDAQSERLAATARPVPWAPVSPVERDSDSGPETTKAVEASTRPDALPRAVPLTEVHWVSATEQDEVAREVHMLDTAADITQRMFALQALARRLAEGAMEEEILDAVRRSARDPDPDLARFAAALESDLDVLRDWRDRLALDRTVDGNGESIADSAPPPTLALSGGVQGLPLTSLQERALWGREAQDRLAALTELGAHPAPETLAILLQARNDSVSDNRREIVEALGRAAMNGIESDGQIDSALQTATQDLDPVVAAAAGRVIEELEQSRSTPAQATTVGDLAASGRPETLPAGSVFPGAQ